jgi:iron complex outermembrane receptor protein
MQNAPCAGARCRLLHTASYGIALAVSALLALSSAADAQSATQPVQSGKADGGDMEEIVVTAQKREQRILDVPISISAFSASAIASRNITNIEELNGLASNVVLVPPNGYTLQTPIAIRGSLTLNTTPYWEPTVGIYLDGVYISKSQGAIFDIADIDHIEILKGPQGTLYGRNTLAGAVNIVTRKPTGIFGGEIELGVGDYGYQEARVGLNLPAFGKLSVKVNGFAEGRDGIVQTFATPGVPGALPPAQSEAGSRSAEAVRLSARLDATDTLRFDYAFDWNDVDNVPYPGKLVYLNDVGENFLFSTTSPQSGLPLAGFLGPDSRSLSLPSNGAYNNGPEFEHLLIRGQTLTASWDLGEAQLKSISGYRWMNYQVGLDLDGTTLPVAGTLQRSVHHEFSQDLQITGQFDRVHYTGGLYYFSEGGNFDNPQQFFGIAPTNQTPDYTYLRPHFTYTTEAFAIYGQGEYTPNILDDKLTLTFGLRYSNESKTGTRGESGVVGVPSASGNIVPFPIVLIPDGTFVSKSWDAVTPTFIAKYDFMENANVYAKYARGFKSGGFNLDASSVAETQHPFDAELVDEYEIGAKMRLLDGRLQISAAAFWDEHSDLQLSVFLPSKAGTIEVVRNAGGSQSRGFELEIQALPTPWLSLSGSLGYTDNTYTSFIDDGVDVANDRAFSYAPPVTATFNVDATVWQGNWGEAHLVVDYIHQDRFFVFPYSLTANPNVAQNAHNDQTDAVNRVNLRLALREIELPGGTGQLTFWVKNLFDEASRNGSIDFGPSFGGMVLGYYEDPRTFGATLRYKF